jgi:hypothetical protein
MATFTSPQITVNNPYGFSSADAGDNVSTYGRSRFEDYLNANKWRVPDIPDNGLTFVEANPNELIFKDSRGIEHRINTNNYGSDISPISPEVADLQSRVISLDDRVLILEGDNAMLIDKLEKLGDIVLDLKNQIQAQAKQKLTVNFGN